MTQRHSRRRIFPVSELRAFRMSRGVTLAEMSVESEKINAFRCSQVERNPSIAQPNEIDDLKAAVERVASRRQRSDSSACQPSADQTKAEIRSRK